MPALSYYSNVHNTALVVLRRKGYRLWTEQKGEVFCAEKDGWDFMAFDPVQLLGIVAIYEAHQPTEHREYWWKLDKPNLYDTIPTKPPKYKPVWKKK